MVNRFYRRILVTTLLMMVMCLFASAAQGQGELSYNQYRALSWAADRMDHLAQFEPLHGETGMYFAIGERFSTVQVVKVDSRGAERIWKSNQLDGVPEEVLTADMNGDLLEDTILCRTSNGKAYAWNMDGFDQVWESLVTEYDVISCFTTANVDEDPATEIVMVADGRIVYVDGENFSKQFSSLHEYQATQVRCGDVDGDGRVEIVLNSGQVLDSAGADVEWEDEAFFGKIELFDVDGDGIPEVLTENPGGGPLKVFDVDYRSEVRFQ